MAETVRAFIAVQLPEEVADGVWQVQDTLQQLPPMHDLRWVDPDDAHITIKFLGETPTPKLPAIEDALDSVAHSWTPFRVKLGPLGAFPNVYRPNNIWLGVEEGGEPFQHLYNAVEVALKPLGIKPERRDFHPHVTLARVPRSWTQTQQRAIGDLIGPTSLPEVPPFTVEAIALLRSVLTEEGSEYTRLANSIFGEEPPLQSDDWEDIL
ncbi:MAG: RNA 2',3'-cyclic phosphodiesterase [Chloroflexota bacterium]|nr:RNA 2',3'-cyclic phosphodiesterase [Chloroflexota bacterium]